MGKNNYKRKKNFRSWKEIGVDIKERNRIYTCSLQKMKHQLYLKHKKQALKILNLILDEEYQRRKNDN